MIRKIIYTMFPAIALTLLLAACDREQFGDEPGTGSGDGKIRFEMTHATAMAVHTDGVPQTRVATSTDGDYTSTWNVGDKVGLYIVKGNGGLQSTGNYVDNLVMEYNGTGWDYNLPTGKEYYPKDGEALHFYAYHPYDENLNDALNMTFAVQTDQSTAQGFRKSHLLTASTPNVNSSPNAVPLAFTHKLALLELKTINGASHGAKMTNLVTTTLEGCQTAVTINLGEGTVTPSGNAASVKMHRVERIIDDNYYSNFTYRALVPAQTVAANTELFLFSLGTSRKLSHKAAAETTFAMGQVKPYDITLSVTLNANHVYAVGDLYPHKGLPMGVVFETSNGGKSGKIVGPEQRRGNWGPMPFVTGADDMNDGRANMATIQGLDAAFSDYPPFKFAHRQNPEGTLYTTGAKGIWYLPAITELLALFSQFTPVNTTLSANGWDTLREERHRYWSSTEFHLDDAFVIHNAYLYVDLHHQKQYTLFYIAIMEF